MKIKYVICINDYPFAVLDSINEQEANDMKAEIQAGIDARKKTGTMGMNYFVHVRNVPIISSVDDIDFGEWDIQLPTVKK